MKTLFGRVVFGLLALFLSTVVFAGDKGTPNEAMALVKKAEAYLKANGKEKAFAAFTDPKGGFVERDMYIYAINMQGGVLAHGANPKLVGKSVIELKDTDGKYFIQNILEMAGTKGTGWVDYKWLNPVTKAIEQKTTYLEKVGDIAILCGIYK